jgi:glycosyltransferase involved in cell wall biosynthesis
MLGGNGSTMQLSAIIVTIPKHLEFLGQCLIDLQNQTLRFDEIVIVASGFSVEEKLELSRLVLGGISPRPKLIFTKMATSGFNRRVGGEFAVGETLFFIDADDRYHPDRNRLVIEAMNEHGVAVCIHSYIRFESEDEDASRLTNWTQTEFSPPSNSILIGAEDVWGPTAENPHRRRDREMLGLVSSNADGKSNAPGHHGHLVIRRESFLGGIRQHEYSFPRNEDSVYLRDKLQTGEKVLMIEVELSAYRTGRTPDRKTLIRRIISLPATFLKLSLQNSRVLCCILLNKLGLRD